MLSPKNFIYRTDILHLDTDKLCQIIDKYGSGDLCQVLRANQIDGEMFLKLTNTQISYWRNYLNPEQSERLEKFVNWANSSPNEFYSGAVENDSSAASLSDEFDDFDDFDEEHISDQTGTGVTNDDTNIYNNVSVDNLQHVRDQHEQVIYENIETIRQFESDSSENLVISNATSSTRADAANMNAGFDHLLSKRQNYSHALQPDKSSSIQLVTGAPEIPTKSNDMYNKQSPFINRKLPPVPSNTDIRKALQNLNVHGPESKPINVRVIKKFPPPLPSKKLNHALEQSEDEPSKSVIVSKKSETYHRPSPPIPGEKPRAKQKYKRAEKLDSENEPFEAKTASVEYKKYPWYKEIDRTQAGLLLENKPNGSFVIRPSTRFYCTLTLLYRNKTYNFGIKQDSNGLFTIGSFTKIMFSSVYEAIDYYMKNEFCLKYENEDVFVKLNNFL